MDNFRMVALNLKDTQFIQQTAQIAYEASQSISKIWLPDLDDAIEEVHNSLKTEDSISWVLMADNTVTAWIAASSTFGKIVEIHPLIVSKAYQRRGLGKRMVTCVTDWAQKQGAMTLFVSTSDETKATSLSETNLYENPGEAIANFHQLKPHPVGFWLKMGFKIIGVLPDAEDRDMPSIMLARPL